MSLCTRPFGPDLLVNQQKIFGIELNRKYKDVKGRHDQTYEIYHSYG
jgi:hypothetical protein